MRIFPIQHFDSSLTLIGKRLHIMLSKLTVSILVRDTLEPAGDKWKKTGKVPVLLL